MRSCQTFVRSVEAPLGLFTLCLVAWLGAAGCAQGSTAITETEVDTPPVDARHAEPVDDERLDALRGRGEGGACEAFGSLLSDPQSVSVESIYEAAASPENLDERRCIVDAALDHYSQADEEPGLESLPLWAHTLEAVESDAERVVVGPQSCKALARIARNHEGPTPPEVAQAVAAGAVLHAGAHTTQRACLVALHDMREQSMDALVRILRDEDPRVRRVTEPMEQPKRRFASARASAHQAAIVALNTLYPTEKAAFLVEYLRSEPTPPEYVEDDHRKFAWAPGEVFVRQHMMLGLAASSEQTTTDVLKEIVTGGLNEKWSAILNTESENALRSIAGLTLAYIGDRGASGVLLDQARGGTLSARKPAIPAMRFDVRMARAFALLAAGDAKDDLRGFIDDQQDRGLVRALESHLPALSLVGKCERRQSPDKRAACYGEAVSYGEAVGAMSRTAQARAFLELSRLPGEHVVGILADAVDGFDAAQDLPATLILAIQRRPHQSILEAVDERWKAATEAETSGHQLTNLAALRAYLQNAADAESIRAYSPCSTSSTGA